MAPARLWRRSIMIGVLESGGPGYLAACGAIRIWTLRVSVCELGTPGNFVMVVKDIETVTTTHEFPAPSVADDEVTVAPERFGASARAAFVRTVSWALPEAGGQVVG